MAKNIAGRILIMPRGTYDANATYEMLDLVMYNNASWLAKKTATGIEPTDGEYWHKMADGVELVTNLTTEVEGKALDASMGKVLKELIDAVGADALRERLDALEVTSATHSNDIEALRLAIEELSNIDNATAGYNADTDSLWVLKDGEKVDALKLYLNRFEFVKDGLNKANLTGTSGTITHEDGHLVITDTHQNQSVPKTSTFTFDELDFSNFEKVVFQHITTFPSNSTDVNNRIEVGIKDSVGNVLTSYTWSGGNKATYSDDILLDISNINGKGSLFLTLTFYKWTSNNESYSIKCKLSQVYAE